MIAKPHAGRCGVGRYALQWVSLKIRHKGLRALHERDDRARLPADVVPRIRRILLRLQEAANPGSADAPGFRLHPLKGDRAGWWSVRVTGNWRVVFRFEHAEVVDVDLIDYH
jgi:proteic killer suppression protein